MARRKPTPKRSGQSPSQPTRTTQGKGKQGNAEVSVDFSSAFAANVSNDIWEDVKQAREERDSFQDDTFPEGEIYMRLDNIKLGVGGESAKRPGVPYMTMKWVGLADEYEGKKRTDYFTLSQEEMSNGQPFITMACTKIDDMNKAENADWTLPDAPTGADFMRLKERVDDERPCFKVRCVNSKTNDNQYFNFLKQLTDEEVEALIEASDPAPAPKRGGRRRRG